MSGVRAGVILSTHAKAQMHTYKHIHTSQEAIQMSKQVKITWTYWQNDFSISFYKISINQIQENKQLTILKIFSLDKT